MKSQWIPLLLPGLICGVGCRWSGPSAPGAQAAPPNTSATAPVAAPLDDKPVEPKPDEPKEPPKEKPIEEPPISVTLQLAQTPVSRGKMVSFSITARNTTKETQALLFHSGQSFDITATPEAARDEKKPVWRWSHGKVFTRALRHEKLAPGEAKTWTATWEQTDNDNNPVPRGKYVIEARITANGGLKAPPVTLEIVD